MDTITARLLRSKGFNASFFDILYSEPSTITPRIFFSKSSFCHCFLKDAGTTIIILLFPSAQSWLIIRPASMVFPRPTSSQRIAPLERGQLKANKAASIWCVLRSTVEETRVWFNIFSSWDGRLRVNSWARIFWKYWGILQFEISRFNSSNCTDRKTFRLVFKKSILSYQTQSRAGIYALTLQPHIISVKE